VQADAVDTIDASLSRPERGSGWGTASAVEGVGHQANAIPVSAIDGDAGERRNAGQSQAAVPFVSRGRIDDAHPTAAADPLEGSGASSLSHEAEPTVVHRFCE